MSFVKKIPLIFCAILLCAAAWTIPCSAENDALSSLQDMASSASFDLPEQAAADLSSAGISPDNPQSVLNSSPADLLRTLTERLKREIAAPLTLCGGLLMLVLLAALLGSTTDAAASGGMKQLADTLCVLICVGSAASPLCTCLTRTAKALHEGRLFMQSFVPVFAGFMAAGGSVAGGSSYHVMMLFLTEGVMQLVTAVFYPLLQCTAGLGIADAVNPSLRLGGFAQSLHKAVTWALGLTMGLFAALLSVRSFAASAADSLGAKTLRMLSSSLIPVVGSAVSEAYGTVKGSIQLLQNGIGVFGILAVISMTLPPLISLLLYRAAFAAAGIAADMAGTASLSTLFRHTGAVLSAAFALLICFALMLIFSSAIVLLMLRGT